MAARKRGGALKIVSLVFVCRSSILEMQNRLSRYTAAAFSLNHFGSVKSGVSQRPRETLTTTTGLLRVSTALDAARLRPSWPLDTRIGQMKTRSLYSSTARSPAVRRQSATTGYSLYNSSWKTPGLPRSLFLFFFFFQKGQGAHAHRTRGRTPEYEGTRGGFGL